MVKIAIDVSCWHNYRGNGRFTRELITAMILKYHQKHQFILVADSETSSTFDFPANVIIKSVPANIKPIKAASSQSSRSIFDILKFSWVMGKSQPDVIFFPTPYTYYPVFNRCPMVLCLHDTMTEKQPQLFFASFQARLFWRIKHFLARSQAQKIVCPSNSAKQDVASYFKIPWEHISLINEAPASIFKQINNQGLIRKKLHNYGISDDVPLILYVGGIAPHKNLDRLIKSLQQLQDEEWQLIIVGDYLNDVYLDCYEQIKTLIEQLDLSNRIYFTGYIEDHDLVYFYNAAKFLILPSLDEGFGLPVIEAMACGTPVAVSKYGALPEVVGDTGLIFDPLNQQDMSTSIDRLLNESELYNSLSQKTLPRASLYSWETAAQKMIEIFLETIN